VGWATDHDKTAANIQLASALLANEAMRAISRQQFTAANAAWMDVCRQQNRAWRQKLATAS